MVINEEIKRWLEKTIIELNLCPFAKLPYTNNQVKVSIHSSENLEEIFDDFTKELTFLEDSANIIETTIMVLPKASNIFMDFQNFVYDLEDSLMQANLSAHFQLVAFHPRFQFEGLDFDDKANWVNRSPYPVIHILRTQSISQVMPNAQEGEKISLANETKIKELSDKQIAEYFWFISDQ